MLPFLVLALAPTAVGGALQDVYAEPLGLQASAEVPIYVSFTTGSHFEYSKPHVDDGTSRMMLSIQLTVFCQPELEPCEYVDLGENENCQKVLEAPDLPPISRCANGPFGIMTLELRGTLSKNTRYDLLVLGTLPPTGKRIQQTIIRTLPAGAYLDVSKVVAHEEATVNIVPEYVTKDTGAKEVTNFALVTPEIAYPGVQMHGYTFSITGSRTPFTMGDEIRLYPSPLIYPDEGLSFGGPCQGFDVSGFSSPLTFVSCRIESLPTDTRVGYNVIVLTFEAKASLGDVAQYLRVAVSTPKGHGSIGHWYAVSKDGSIGSTFDKVIPASTAFFVEPQMDIVTPAMSSMNPGPGVSQALELTVFPRLNIIGRSDAPPQMSVVSPTFHVITFCGLINPSPDIAMQGSGKEAYCALTFQDNQNLYIHQSVTINIDVQNPQFAIEPEHWKISVTSGNGVMSASQTYLGWPVYSSLEQAFIVPLSMEYAQYNELQVFFRPRLTSPQEPRALIIAPAGYLFELGCGFDIIMGFPDPGVTCSNPLSEIGRNLFSLQMPMSTAFERGTFYAANVYTVRNPFPGSHSSNLDKLPWRIDITTRDGLQILETTRDVPMGPELSGFNVYPAPLFDNSITTSARTPSAENNIVLRFRLSEPVTVHGERLRITASYGTRWKLGASIQIYVGEKPATIAMLTYDASYPPVIPPYNQIELTLVNPDMPAMADVTVHGTIINAQIEPELNEDVRSANSWVIELYEPGAGYKEYGFRHQASIFSGFELQAITSGSVTAWLALAQRNQLPIMLTFRLGSSLALATDSSRAVIEFTAPVGFTFPVDCAAQRISPEHQEGDGYARLPVGSIASCTGRALAGDDADKRRLALLSLTPGAVVEKRKLYAVLVQVIIPGTFPLDNTWKIRTLTQNAGQLEKELEQQSGIQGFRLAQAFLSAAYHPGTSDTGEDLRGGASDNRVMFSLQAASTIPAGGELRVTAPYRFTFAMDCLLSIIPSAHILAELEGEGAYQDLPRIRLCRGDRNFAKIVLAERLDVAIRYTFRLSVSNPVLPHPAEWPFPQNVWRFESYDPVGAPLNTAQVTAFFLWAFAHSSVIPVVFGTGEQGVVSIEVEPSLTIPPLGSLLITAPSDFVLPAPCVDFQRDTFGEEEGFSPLPIGTTCMRGPGGPNVLKLQLDGFSYLAAGVRFRFKISVVNPPDFTADRVIGDEWSIASAEQTDFGESFLEQNPAVVGFPVHSRLKSFTVSTSSFVAGSAATAHMTLAIQDSLGVFEVVTTTEASYLVVDMPPLFTVPSEATEQSTTAAPAIGSSEAAFTWMQCLEFTPVYPEENFPAAPDSCVTRQGSSSFRLHLSRNIVVGPVYEFSVQVLHPMLTGVRQQQIIQANFWQVRLIRIGTQGEDVTYASRSTGGYRLLPRLQDCTVTPSREALPVRMIVRISITFKPVTKLTAAAGNSILLQPPASISILVGQDSLCTLLVNEELISAACVVVGNGVRFELVGDAEVVADGNVKLEVIINAGATSLFPGQAQNQWTVETQDAQGTAVDRADNLLGFTVYPRVEGAQVVPQDLFSMSFANHAEFRFQVTDFTPAGSRLLVLAPENFVLYPRTLDPGTLPGAMTDTPPHAEQGNSLAEAIISFPFDVPVLQPMSFRLTVGNPAVSPPQNRWTLEVRDAANNTLSINHEIEGFIVQSQFNTSLLEADLDEPLAENYIHLTVAVSQPLLADSFRKSSQCTSSEKLCVFATWLEVTAPEGFVFKSTCGYWSLARVGSRYRSLPPGSLCRADPEHLNIARVQISLTLEALILYEFTLQVRNSLSVPLNNFWRIQAVQDGIVRERNDQMEGFPLRQLRTVRITPTTTLAGVVDNTVTVQLRSERPVPKGSSVQVVAPVGFVFDAALTTASFKQDVLPEVINEIVPNAGDVMDSTGSSIRFFLSQQDFVAPNAYFFVSMRVRNPPDTPNPNFWYFYVQSQFSEHIDLQKYYPGFMISHMMHFCQVYPHNLPWMLGTATDVSLLFVTKYPIFTRHRSALAPGTAVFAGSAEPSGDSTSWQLVLVAPSGFSFPTKSKFSDQCSAFERWGGKESYDQLPDTMDRALSCEVRTARSVIINVPSTFVNETRYSFRLNVTVASSQADVAIQEPWKLTVLESGQLLHSGESPSPLLGVYYEAKWFWAPTSGLPDGADVLA